MMTSYIRIGGLALEAPLDFSAPRAGIHQGISGKDRRILEPADRQPDLHEPAQGRGIPVAEDAVALAVTGAGDARFQASISTYAAICPTPAMRNSSSSAGV